MTPEGLLAELHQSGIQLRAEGENLRLKAPKGALTSRLKDALALHKAALLSLLQQPNGREEDRHENGDVPAQESCLFRLVLAQARRRPDFVAVRCGQEQLDYQELIQQAASVAARLRAAGVARETMVTLVIEPSLDFVVGLLGILQAGGACQPLECPTELGEQPPAGLATSRVVLTRERHLPRLAGYTGTIVCLDSPAPVSAAGHFQPVGDSLALGLPALADAAKLVALSHDVVARAIAELGRELGIGAGDVLFEIGPPSCPQGMLVALLSLTSGAQLLLSGPSTLDAARSATLLWASPRQWRRLLAEGWLPQAGARLVSYGEPIDCALAERLQSGGAELWNLYGGVEASLVAAFERVPRGECRAPHGGAHQPVRLRLLDENLAPVPNGVPGDVYVSGASLARGYYALPEQTAARFLPDPYSTRPGERFFQTGDRARRLKTGILEWLDRPDQAVRLGRFRLEPRRIEDTLRGHAAVQDAAVDVHIDASGRPCLTAYVVPQPGAALVVAELERAAKEQLPSHLVPAAYVTLAALPLLPSGLLNTAALPAPPARRDGAAARARPADDADAQVARTNLTKNQFLTWAAGKLFPELPVYNCPLAFVITGPIQPERFRAAFQALVDQSDALRTVVDEVDGLPRQRVLPRLDCELELLDFSTAADPRVAALEWTRQRSLVPLDIAVRPFDAALLKLSPEQSIWLLNQHHMLTDGWSMALSLKYTAQLYARLGEGSAEPLSMPPYHDFVAKERQQFGSDDYLRAKAYWQAKLADDLEPLAFYGTAAKRSTRVVRVSRTLDAGRSAELRRLLREDPLWRGPHGSLANVFGALFVAFLHRLSGQPRMRLATPLLNRPTTPSKQSLGLFAQMTPLAFAVDGDETFVSLARKFQKEMLDSRRHRHYTTDNPVDRRAYDVMFNFHASAFARFGSWPVETVWFFPGHEHDSLALQVRDFDERGAFELDFDFHCDVFAPDDRPRAVRHFLRVLDEFCRHPHQQIDQVRLLAPEEEQELLVDFNRAGPLAPCGGTILASLEAQRRRTPNETAVICGQEALTYAELHERAGRLANVLRGHGLRPGMLAGICLERSTELVVALLAVLKAGGAYVPIDPGYPQERLAAMLADARTPVLITMQSLADRLQPFAGRMVLLDSAEVTQASEHASPANLPSSEVSPDHRIYAIFTSGSTGRPKLAAVRHGGFANLMAWFLAEFAIGREDCTLVVSSFNFDLTQKNFFAPLMTGGKLVLLAGSRYEPGEVRALVARHGVTLLNCTPSAFYPLVEHAEGEGGQESPPSLRCVFLGGEPISVPRLAGWKAWHAGRAEVVNTYGPTECTDICAFHRVVPPAAGAAPSSPPVGRVVPNCRLYVLDAACRPLPRGVPGELYIGGAGVGHGYLNDPALTAGRFLPDPYDSVGGARLYKSGDLVRWLPDGNLEYLGRVDHQVKVRGFRIELGEIEDALGAHPLVRQAVVTVREDSPGDKRIVAYVVAKTDGQSAGGGPESLAAEWRTWLRNKLPDYMVPARYVLLDALPLSPNGKVDRKALPAPDRGRSGADSTFVAPRSDVERVLSETWCEVLGLERVGIHDNFFELGGDSIQTIQVISRATRAGLRFAPRDLFQHQTIAGLASVCTLERTAPAALQSEQGLVEGPVPLTPIQQAFLQQDWAEPWHFNHAVLLEVRQPLAPALLDKAMGALLTQHDALRMRFVRETEKTGNRQSAIASWHQFNAGDVAAVPCTHLIDLAGLPADEQPLAVTHAASQLQASLDLAQGPVARMAYFSLGAGRPGRLLLVIHHLVVDGVSWRILWEDFLAAYQQLSLHQPVRLPPKTSSFKEWAERMSQYAGSPQLADELDYWRAAGQVLEGQAPPARMPVDHSQGTNTWATAESLSIALDEAETESLLKQVPAAYRTQINDVLLAALARALACWTGGQRLAIDLEGHGREDVFPGLDVSRTVGWFTAMFPVVLDLTGCDGPIAALKTVKEQLRSVPRRGLGYGVLRFLGDERIARPLAEAQPAEVSFNYLGQSDQLLPSSAPWGLASESSGPAVSRLATRFHLLEINGGVSGGRLRLSWTFSREVHRRETIARLADDFLQSLREIIAHCLSSAAGGCTPSDFPLAGLDQAALDRLSAGNALADVEDVYGLSPMQQGLMFHALYAPGSGVYFEQFSNTFDGTLDLVAFERAWAFVVRRHAILRTSFAWEGLPRPVQIVHKQVRLPIEVQDWRSLDAAAQELRLAEFLQADRHRDFALDQPPLVRMALFRLALDRYQFTWSFHHLLMDGWSGALLLKEVLACYEAESQRREIQLEPPGSFRDYIAWLARQDRSRAEGYWRRKLQGFAAPTPVRAAAMPRRSDQEPEYGASRTLLSVDVTAALVSLSRQHQLTLSTVIQGAWALLLGRYTGERDVVFGTTSSGRPPELPGVESTIGLFVSTLPLRVELPPRQAALAFLERLQADAAEMRQYEYSTLVEIHEWSEVPRGVPLFESLQAYENYPVDSSVKAKSGNLGVRELRSFEKTNYPLTLMAAPGAQLWLKLMYDGRLYDEAAAARLLGHLAALLSGIAAAPACPLADLPLLSAAEERQLLHEWNDTARPLDRECVHRQFEVQALRAPDALAVTLGGRQLTYGELNRRANQLARHLKSLGVGPDVPVAVCTEREPEMLVALLAVLKAGGAYLPLDPAYPPARLAYMLHDSRSPVLLAQESVLERVPANANIVCLDRDWRLVAGLSCEDLPPTAGCENLAYVIYTSGSTGQPKGVAVPHAGLANLAAWHRRLYRVTADDRGTQVAGPAFDASVWELWPYLAAGASIHFVDEATRSSPAKLIDWLAAEGVTLCFLPTPLAEAVLDERWPPATALRALLTGGEQLKRRPPLGLPFALVNHYGPTENSVVSTWATVDAGESALLPSIGRPVENHQVYVLDCCRNLVPIGVPGELHVAGAGLARGYLHQPGWTAERFVPDPFSTQPGSRMYRTGDLVRYLPDGNLEFLGRFDQQVKVRGYRIELGEIEQALTSHPAVRQAVVLAREDRPGDRRLAAYVVVDPDHDACQPGLNETAEAGTSPAPSEAEQVSSWQTLYDQTYRQEPSEGDEAFNIVGWNSSYTGQPIPAGEMREWVEGTVERILALKPARVLEIGCGTGLLLWRVAPRCAEYVATDFSEAALEFIRARLAARHLPQVRLSRRLADDFSASRPAHSDLVVINSVVQYFPDIHYLRRVLEGAVRAVAPGGAVFVGDVRSAPLLRAFHASVELFQASASLPLTQLQDRMRQQAAQDNELVIDPDFFFALQQRTPGIAQVRFELKRGRAHNELTRFRYDAVLAVGPASEAANPARNLDWQAAGLTLPSLHRLLDEQTPASLCVTGVPNSRLRSETAFEAVLGSEARPLRQVRCERRVAALAQAAAAIDPEDLWAIARELPYDVEVAWSPGCHDGRLDVLFTRRTPEPPAAGRDRIRFPRTGSTDLPWRCYANDPTREARFRQFVPRLREHLAGRLPGWMVPTVFVPLDALPISANGKIDRQALPSPDAGRGSAERASVAPRDPDEMALVHIWEDVLGLRPIGVTDSYFELGGNSLLAVRLAAEIERHFQQELPLAALFEAPTVERLAGLLRRGRSAQSWSPLVPIQPAGKRPPFFCIHPAGGNVLGYFELARALGLEQPFYGLQARGLDGRLPPHARIEDMAADYVAALRGAQPQGPYRLGGYSLGGIIAFEMAVQLQRQGEEVALLAMLDAVPLMGKLAADVEMPFERGEHSEDDDALWLIEIVRALARITRKPLPVTIDDLQALAGEEQLRYVLGQLQQAGMVPPGAGLSMLRGFLAVQKAIPGARAGYAPPAYGGRITVFRAAQARTGQAGRPAGIDQADPTLGCSAYSAVPVEVHDLAADHTNLLLEPHVQALARSAERLP